MLLPCAHRSQLTSQVEPTIELLSDMDELHPDVLLEHGIEPEDYKGGLVFRSAIESIRGSFIASSMTHRQALVRDVLENLRQREAIHDYEQTSSGSRYDFTVHLESDRNLFAALEVKGGEGNSINISERPIWAAEFAIWSHLDGAVVNQPSHGAHSVINRLTNELVRREKLVDVLFFKDVLCGTRVRPCPKYPRRRAQVGLKAAPDVFLFPQRVPTPEEPAPPVHTLDTLALPRLILQLFGVKPDQYDRHVWEVHVELEDLEEKRRRRLIEVHHQGEVVDQSTSRAWRE